MQQLQRGVYRRDEVLVSNLSSRPVRLRIYPVDGVTGATSGAVYTNRGEKLRGAARWLHTDIDSLALAPHAQKLVPFVVWAPRAAQAGDHLAGVAVENASHARSGGRFSVTEPLLHRGGRGVQLTDDGASLIAGARSVLDGRDALMEILSDIRGERPSPIAGIRELVGGGRARWRSTTLPEARLAETERVLELVLRASATAVTISDPETSVMHEVNDAFCRLTGRSREELVGRRATDHQGSWAHVSDRDALLEELRRTGTVARRHIRIRRPDGPIRIGNLSAHLLSIAGTTQVLSTIDDVTEQYVLETDQTAGVGFYRAVTEVSKLLLSGGAAIDSIASVLPTIHSTSQLTSVLLWNLEDNRPLELLGEPPPEGLGSKLRGAVLATDGAVVARIGVPGAADGVLSGWAVRIPSEGLALVLLTREQISATAQGLYHEALSDLASLAGRSGVAR